MTSGFDCIVVEPPISIGPQHCETTTVLYFRATSPLGPGGRTDISTVLWADFVRSDPDSMAFFLVSVFRKREYVSWQNSKTR